MLFIAAGIDFATLIWGQSDVGDEAVEVYCGVEGWEVGRIALYGFADRHH